MKPILFNTEMVRAILDGRKTMTRRAVKPQPTGIPALKMYQDDVWRLEWWNLNEFHLIKVPICPGDILYVRETWQYAYDLDGNEQPIEGTGRYLYAADNLPEPFGFWVNPDGTHRDSMPWRPSIHMPREAARVFLRVKNVYPQQLKDVTDVDARAEGFNSRDEFMIAILKKYPNCTEDSWFWADEFERCEKPEDGTK